MEANTKVGAGRFTLVRPLGRGGMGEVWLAQDERLHEPVALKFLPAEIRTDEVALDDLRHETARSRKLTHANIVRIHDLHEDPAGLAFIAMEYVDGPTLAASRLQQPERVFRWEFLKPLVQQLCAALNYAHGERVIHRDLKPANMMLDSRGRLKLAGFGIAATVSDSVSRVSLRHSTSGTLAYMSPQQLLGKRPIVADDIYALGATLYELLTSKPPFYAGDLTHQVIHEPPEPLVERLATLEIQNEIPPDVAALVMACLAKDPTQRPQSAAAVAGWIGLAAEKTHSVEDMAGAMFPGAIAGESQPDSAGPSFIISSKRIWIPVVGVSVLLFAGMGVWQFAKHRVRSTESPHSVPRADSQTAAQTSSPEASAFVSLFNGRDLSGWDGDPKVWSVKDGAITARITGAEKPTNYFLIRRDLTVADFELRALCRFVGGSSTGPYPGNLGLSYRGKDVGDRDIHGYQFDLQSDAIRFPGTGAIGEMHPKGRKTLAKVGQKTVAWPGGGVDEFQVVGTASAKEEVFGAIKKNDWNELVILAKSNRITHQINGLVASELTDNNEARRALSGLVALKAYFYQGPQVTAQFKDIRLKRFAAASSETPPVGVAKEPGFVSLFNGRDLTGWEGDKTYWSVRDGAIVGRVEGEWRTVRPLFWSGGDVGDFELRFSFWQPPSQGPAHGAPGVCFRAVRRADLPSYDVDIHNMTNNHAELRDVGGRNLIAPAGKQVIAPTVGGTNEFRELGAVATPAELEANYKYGGWNDVTIVAQANRIRTWINGQLQFDSTDENEIRRHRLGLLALKLFSNRGMSVTAKFKDIRLKRLAGAETAATSDFDHWKAVLDRSGIKGRFWKDPNGDLKLNLDKSTSDLGPLKGIPLHTLFAAESQVSNLSPLEGMPLKVLGLRRTQVKDLTPLKGMPVEQLALDECPNSQDLSPLVECPRLQSLSIPATAEGIDILRRLSNLKHLSYSSPSDGNWERAMTTDEFWKNFSSRNTATQ